jgi:hypothetical protein
MKAFEYQGFWWLPSDPQNKVPGILKFDPEKGTKLKLLGSLNLTETRLSLCNDLIFYANILLGETSSKRFTLYKCTRYETGIKKSVFNVEFIFEGSYFYNEEDIIFDCINLSYPNLNKWANIPGTCMNVAKPDTVLNGRPKEYYYFRENEDIEAKLKGFKIIISFNQLVIPKIPNELDLVQSPHIQIKFDHKVHFSEYKKSWEILTKFLTLGMGKAIYPLYITGYNELDNGINVFYNVNSTIPPIEDFSWTEIFFLLNDIDDIFEKCLNNWYNKVEKFKPVYNL